MVVVFDMSAFSQHQLMKDTLCLDCLPDVSLEIDLKPTYATRKEDLSFLPIDRHDEHKDDVSSVASTLIVACHQRCRATTQLSRCKSVGNAKRLQEPF